MATSTTLRGEDTKEVYVSTDVEADGPIPGPYSMLSFASAAYLSDRTLIDTFSANLESLPNATTDPKTMQWWKNHHEAWVICRGNPLPPQVAMRKYLYWVKSLPGVPVFVAYPLAYDFMFVYWYLMRFAGESPFSIHGIDIRTYAMAILKIGYKDCTKKTSQNIGFPNYPTPTTH